jgi:hypothetical protein
MKTLRILLAVFVVLCIVVPVSNAQDKKTSETYSWDWEGYGPCTNEVISGMESCDVTTWDGKYKCKYEGIYKGLSSGKTYTMFAIENGTAKGGGASNETFIFKAVFKCEGIPIAIGTYKFHITTNANGDITVEKENGAWWEWICL